MNLLLLPLVKIKMFLKVKRTADMYVPIFGPVFMLQLIDPNLSIQSVVIKVFNFSQTLLLLNKIKILLTE